MKRQGLNFNQIYLAKKGSTVHYMHNEKKNLILQLYLTII